MGFKNGGLGVQLLTDTWTEPDWGHEDPYNLTGIPINATLFVSPIELGVSYSCVCFENISNIPEDTNFLYGKYSMRWDFKSYATSHSFRIENYMISNGTYFYRCSENELLLVPVSNTWWIILVVLSVIIFTLFGGFCLYRLRRREILNGYESV